ncbi:hypothetical protein AKJ41_05740 [candidate division MSBL1 archaeon SCGC-AAA259O05]|uniref:Uncharacterized protein n=1 Tax=candidate division MSBL1 archaeon SCGC-AAA259O05 TaxID=1698271 RepID=A0A133UYK6_9EURY|nr:hypothetical protein AKJ41_05740 [candidate division MSBL1 archaeon SCGC-AAA259O05]
MTIALSKPLLVPVFKEKEATVGELSPFSVDKNLVKEYLEWIGNKRILLAEFPSLNVPKINKIDHALEKGKFKPDGKRPPMDSLRLLASEVDSQLEGYDGLDRVDDRIIHFKKISVRPKSEEDFNKVQEKIEKVKEAKDRDELKSEYWEQYDKGEISREELTSRLEKLSEENPHEEQLGENFKITKKLANHYYLPLILSEDEKQSYLTHIIDVDSEVEFLKALESCLDGENELFESFDWWFFSKIDETVDDVYIPYRKGSERNEKFRPDFVFWFKKSSKLHILFVDPKSYEFSEYLNKINGYQDFFEKVGQTGETKSFEKDGLEVTVHLALYTEDKEKVPRGEHKQYWHDSIESILATLR